MFKKMLACITSAFKQKTYQSELERYVISKQPTDVADVERYVREYDKSFFGRSYHGYR